MRRENGQLELEEQSLEAVVLSLNLVEQKRKQPL